ncbi:GNAT family N-acetyltransferase [Agrobacterium rhizogenes]|uniref:GNAT family N-acetyltransferase n=1 Tax=Rhizobium rhizogenes TaxID=359 RepID=UPI00115F4483|nr:GNAT family N-acetyltransferase [Rhizobium rhizogenes]NTG05310.1 GNAT family N-acetyltransferase [Rhizobium rhizogenes]NTG11896.1 GNAT family N-acetyltransferase [Rhizobium rhizogenes]NTG90726.1 GNAT family N-acetyltransferase [Rhizobium rhizogenes]NTH48905.1 GNAT family N-acetyltransferase [Rhizobium rhizogenes]NTH61788.1 GNAT family N-acetyltransferase [Rhizobium rhizogenes]
MKETRDKNRLQLHRSLNDYQVNQLVALFQEEWWTKGRTRADVIQALASGGPVFAFIDLDGDELVAFARVITDGVYKAMIFDIIVKDTWRNTGLGGLLMETVMNDPALINIKHRELYCLAEMVPFYQKWGFTDHLPGLHFMRKSA